MTEFVPWVRILLYIVAGYLLNKGLPPQAASIITDDPLVLEAVSNFLAGAITILTVMWWRLAKRFGWPT